MLLHSSHQLGHLDRSAYWMNQRAHENPLHCAGRTGVICSFHNTYACGLNCPDILLWQCLTKVFSEKQISWWYLQHRSFQCSSSQWKPPRQPLRQREELSYFKILEIKSFLYSHSWVLAWRRDGSAKIPRERLLLQYVWLNQKQEILVRACLMRLPASSKAGLVLVASAKWWGGDAAEGNIWRWVKW